MKKYILLPLLIVATFFFARWSLYTVDAAEYVYVTVLGQPSAIYDGADKDNGAGLKFGWPWPITQVQRLDRRLQQFDLPPVEQLTNDPAGKTIDKILLVEAYVCWKIADREAVDRFVRRIGTATRAKTILEPRINGELGKEIGKIRMDDLVTDKKDEETGKYIADLTAEKLRDNLLANLRGQVFAEYGIDIIDIRLRRFNHPPNVRESIFLRIKSERNKKVTEYDSEGLFQASKIASQNEQERRTLLATARAEEEKIKADADIAAAKIRNDAYSQDPEFYEFLKKMEKMQSIVGDGKTMLLLSTSRQMFESLFQQPRPKAASTPDKKKEGK